MVFIDEEIVSDQRKDVAAGMTDGAPSAELSFADRGGECGAIIRALDWSRTRLGPMSEWPQSLRTSVSTMLRSPYPITLFWGRDLVMLYNDPFCPIHGDKHPAMMGMPAPQGLAEAWSLLGPLVEKTLATGEPLYVENGLVIFARRPGGLKEESYFTWSYNPTIGENGEIVGLFAIASETTRQVIGERRLGTLRELSIRTGFDRNVERVFASVQDVLATAGADVPFALLYVVEGDEARLVSCAGLTRGALAASLALKLDDACPWPLAAVARGGREEITLDLDDRFGLLPGGPWPEPTTRALLLPVPMGATETTGVLVCGLSPLLALDDEYRSFLQLLARQVSSSISSARAYEQETQRAEKLAELDRAKTDFFSNVSHEFRTPLTLILGPVEDALSEPKRGLDGEQLELVRRNVLRLYKMVNTLLDFSRVEAGRARAAFVATDLAAFTESVASHFRSAAESAGLELVVDCPALPETVFVDPDMWEKIVLNLLSNAVKYTHRGRIKVALAAEAESVVLSVQDTGVGIAEGELTRVFDRFYRVRDAHGRSHEGTGIGLALARELVELHRGRLSVASKLGVGTTFTVRIPRGSAHLPEARIERTPQTLASSGAAPFVQEAIRWSSDTSEPPASSSEIFGETTAIVPPSLVTSRILFVDDNADLRSYAVGLLGRIFPNVETATNGREALEQALVHPPDVIISDVMMPVMDGFELVRALRADERTRSVPVILLSARAGDESTVEGLEAGADDYLVKPFSARELIARVRTRLEMDAMRRQSIAQAQSLKVLEEQKQWTERVLNTMPVPLLFMEPGTGRITFANSAADEMSGGLVPKGTPAEQYDTVYRLTDEQDRPIENADAPAARAARGEDLRAAPVVWHTDAGRFSLLVDSKLLPTMFGHDPAVVLTLQDVTSLVQARTKLEEAIRVREEFLSIASHELRTPLTPLEVQLHTLERHSLEIAKDEAAHAWLQQRVEMLRRQHDRLTRLVDQLLDVSQVMSGAPMALELEQLDLGDVVKSVLTEMEGQGDFKRASCELRFHSEASIRGAWDRSRLERVVRNLVTNACKFGAGKPITVTVAAQEHGALVRVRDEGIGLSSSDLERIFGRFERAVSNKHFGGLGLGLYIARQIVEAMGGSIRVESTPGEGAAFTVMLPLRLQAADGEHSSRGKR